MSVMESGVRPPPSRRRRLLLALLAGGGALLLTVGLVQAARNMLGTQPRPAETGSAGAAPPEVVKLEQKVEEDSSDWSAWAELGSAYVTAARVASDPSFYPKAEKALERSLEIKGAGENWQALAGQGALAAGRHDFAKAIGFAEQAHALQPQSPFIQGLIVDCLTELGRYPEAAAAAQEMVDFKPNFASFARVSYQRELRGDVPGAIEAFQTAFEAAGTIADKSFATYHLGELEFNRGAFGPAEEFYNETLRLDPQNAQALAGIGKVKAARGDKAGAIRQYEKAVAIFPDPELLKELGDLLTVQGDERKAARKYAAMERENNRQRANGVNINLEVALSSADRKTDLARGLAAARDEWRRRQSLHVADALAWQLHAHGRFEEALGYSDKALALGIRNASMYFHRAEINTALGRPDAARADYETARSINPHFSPLYEKRLAEAA